MTDLHGLSQISNEVYKVEDRVLVEGYQELNKAHVAFDTGFKATTYFNTHGHHY